MKTNLNLALTFPKHSRCTKCMCEEEFVKKEYVSSVEGPSRRGRPLGRWEDRVKEYVSERGVRGNGSEWAS